MAWNKLNYWFQSILRGFINGYSWFVLTYSIYGSSWKYVKDVFIFLDRFTAVLDCSYLRWISLTLIASHFSEIILFLRWEICSLLLFYLLTSSFIPSSSSSSESMLIKCILERNLALFHKFHLFSSWEHCQFSFFYLPAYLMGRSLCALDYWISFRISYAPSEGPRGPSSLGSTCY